MSATITPVAKVASNSPGRTPGSMSSVKRKPPPTLVFRYPEPDPEDPFAPLNKLRFIASNGVIGTCTEEKKEEEEECPSTSFSDDEWLASAKKDKRRSYTLYPSPPAPSVHPYTSSAQHSRVTPTKYEKRASTSAPHYRRRTQHVARTLPIGAPDAASFASSWTSVPPPLIPDDGRTSTESSLTGHESDSSVRTKASSRLSRLLPRSKSKKRASSMKSEPGVSMPSSGGLAVPSTHSHAASTPSSPLPSTSQLATRSGGQSPSPPHSAPPSAFITISNFSNRMAQSSGSIVPLPTPEPTEPSSPPHASRLGIYRSASFKHSMTSTPDISSTPHRRNRQTSVTGVPPSLEAGKVHNLSPPKRSLDSRVQSASSSFILVDDSSDDSLASSSQKRIDSLSSPSPPPSSALPSAEELATASSLHVVAENGIRTQFSDLFTVGKTVVIFLRHFWCSFDHAYLQGLSKEIRRVSLPQDVKIVLIGSGSPSIIKSYRQIFQLPVQLYVDPTRSLYHALGMRTLQCTPGSTPSSPNPPAVITTGSQRKGSLKFILRAVRAGMPMWDRSGDLDQLGGEFVFDQGMKPVWAHRMAIVDGRSPAQVLIDVCMPPPPPQPQPTAIEKELGLVSSDESGASSPSGFDSGFEDDEEDLEEAGGKLFTLEEFFKSDKKQRDSRRVTTLHTALTQSPTSPFRLELERIQRAESSRSDETREDNVEDGIEDCIVNARNPRELLLPMSEDEERIFMENRRRSLLRLTNKKSQRRGFMDQEGNIIHALGEAPSLSPVDERVD